MKVLLLTPYIQSNLGLAIFRLPRNAHELIRQRMVLLPEPVELANNQPGIINWQGMQDNDYSAYVLEFLNNPEVRSILAKKDRLKAYVESIKYCQLTDGEYCHKELTVTAYLDGYIRTCWHHDSEMRKGNYDSEKAKSVVEQNIQQCIVIQIQQDLRHQRTICEADIVLFAIKNHLRKHLSEGLLRHFFKLRPFVRDNKESSTGFEDPLSFEMENLSKAILALKADDDPPLQYMAKPKPLYIRSEKWLRWVKSQPCMVCGKGADDPHHLIGLGKGTMGSKADDLDCIPLCRYHHNELHQNVKAFEDKYGSQVELWHDFFLKALKIGALVVD